VEEELAIPIRIMVGEISLVVDRDVGADEPGLTPRTQHRPAAVCAAIPDDFTSVPVPPRPAVHALEEV